MPYDATGAFRLYRVDRIPEGIFGLVTSRGYSFFFESLTILNLNRSESGKYRLHCPRGRMAIQNSGSGTWFTHWFLWLRYSGTSSSIKRNSYSRKTGSPGNPHKKSGLTFMCIVCIVQSVFFLKIAYISPGRDRLIFLSAKNLRSNRRRDMPLITEYLRKDLFSER